MPRHSIEAESNEIKSVSLAKATEVLLKAERIVRWKADSHLDVGMSEFFASTCGSARRSGPRRSRAPSLSMEQFYPKFELYSASIVQFNTIGSPLRRRLELSQSC